MDWLGGLGDLPGGPGGTDEEKQGCNGGQPEDGVEFFDSSVHGFLCILLWKSQFLVR